MINSTKLLQEELNAAKTEATKNYPSNASLQAAILDATRSVQDTLAKVERAQRIIEEKETPKTLLHSQPGFPDGTEKPVKGTPVEDETLIQDEKPLDPK